MSQGLERLSLRATILLAAIIVGTLIGGGIFLGLRSQGASAARAGDRPEDRGWQQVPASPEMAATTTPARAREPQGTEPPGPVTAATGASAEQVAREATTALEQQRATLVAKCWDPSFARDPKPASAKYTYDMTFDATGKEIARGISEPREKSRHDTARCLQLQPMGLQVSPPGSNVRVSVELVLP